MKNLSNNPSHMRESSEAIDTLTFYGEAADLLQILETTPLSPMPVAQNGIQVRGEKTGPKDFILGIQKAGLPENFLFVTKGYSNHGEDSSIMVKDDPNGDRNALRVAPDGTIIRQNGDSKKLLDKCIEAKEALRKFNKPNYKYEFDGTKGWRREGATRIYEGPILILEYAPSQNKEEAKMSWAWLGYEARIIEHSSKQTKLTLEVYGHVPENFLEALQKEGVQVTKREGRLELPES